MFIVIIVLITVTHTQWTLISVAPLHGAGSSSKIANNYIVALKNDLSADAGKLVSMLPSAPSKYVTYRLSIVL